MRSTLRNILDGVASAFRPVPESDRMHEEFRKQLDAALEGRPGDFEMVMLDLRRVILRNLDTIPPHERRRVREQLDASRVFDFERRLGLDDYAGSEREPNGQLELFDVSA